MCKTVLVQRKEQVLAECDRLYPKMKGKPKDYVIQLFEDPYADPVDLSAVPPAGLEPVPAEIKYMPKGEAVSVLIDRSIDRDVTGSHTTAFAW